MSLRVWLPLNGDLKNNGLDNITVTNNGATVDNNGKIGKCYSFSSKHLSIPNPITVNNEAFSISCWVYITEYSSGYSCIFGSRSQISGKGVALWVTSTTIRFDDGEMWSPSYSFQLNTWTHIAVVWSLSGKYIYVNGNLISSKASVSTLANLRNTLWIGDEESTTPTYCLKGKLNDFRIYDHVLSAKEVKEISKGLVCHYKLNNSNKGYDNILTNSTGYNGTTNWSGVISVSTENGHPFFIARRTDITSTSRTFVTHSAITSLVNNWGTGTEFTISGYYKIPSNEDYNVTANLFIRWTHKSGENAYTDTGFSTPSNVEKDKWIRFENTYSVPSNYVDGAVNFYLSAFNKGLSTVYWKDIKLEKGNKATIWSPSSSDAEYIKLGYNNTTIYDCSGYNYHGEIWRYDSLGNIEVSLNTPRNSLSTYVNSENNTTNTASGTIYIYGHCELTSPKNLTVSFWCKPIAGYGNTVGQGQFCLTNISIGSNAGSDYDKSAMNHRDNIIDFSNGTTTYHKTIPIPFTANEWHHYAISYDGRYMKVFKDGVQTATSDMGSEQTLCSIKGAILGFSKAGGVWRSNKSYYSDFRLYTTTLSEDDVKELYQTSASIDKNGNMFTYEFKED